MLEKLNIKLLLPVAVIGLIFIIVAAVMGDSLSGFGTVGLLVVMVIAQVAAGAAFIQSQLSNRLAALRDYLALVISTDKAPEQPLVDDSNDELGEITSELSTFISQLGEVIEEIRAESEMLSQGSSQLASQMGESVNAVDESSNQIEQMADSITQVAETSGVLSESAERVSETTSRVMEILAQGTSSSNTSQISIESVTQEVNSMADDLALLQEECSRIGSVLDVIRGIAEQTNLLALNAAIEAARAGEQGRGFAVVADEVRALAHRTQESTVEIQSMVEGLQEKSNNAVSAIARGQELAQESLSHSQQVVEALDQVGDAFADVDNLTSQIASGTDEQRLSTSSINENMSTVVGLSREITSGLASVAEHAEQQKITSAAVDTTLNKICV
ncbi:methyl-accepting chemotaxis protein [Thalassotalea euphylliae]|uniref:methyl-accepting chemotaxis protein n=1 Tax=Thalassotalea euphylliae TaxID=1655234 RepID=UPI0036371D5F